MNGLPTVTAERGHANHRELDLLVAADNPWLEGHFPGLPILPGVVQIGWAVHFAGALCGFEGGVSALEQVKFKRPIRPGARLTLHLKPDAATRKLRYEFRDAEFIYSSGTLNFGPAA